MASAPTPSQTTDQHFSKQKLWGGRFSGETDPLMAKYNDSLSFDQRMYKEDIRGSQAYARALEASGLLTSSERQTIVEGLTAVEAEWTNGTFVVRPADEDIHTANERRLSELVGPVGGKLHTGRSRNDQVATDMRLYLRAEVHRLSTLLKDLIHVIRARADAEVDYLMPGYTHLQRAQPIRWSHYILSYAFFYLNDLERLNDLLPRLNTSPLGSGAFGGNPFGIDRAALAKDLGFDSIAENSLFGVSDRDFVVEFLQWASLLMIHISKMAEDLIIHSTAEFGFVSLSDAYSTGSSIMPQKKNADSLELLRGKSGRVFGMMSGFMVTLKGTPCSYNKDLQEDKEPLFACIDTVSDSLQILNGVLATLKVHPEKMEAALTSDMLATDLANYLVRKHNVPFRETHHISGRCVALAEALNTSIDKLTLQQLQDIDPRLEEDVLKCWDPETSVESRASAGGPARSAIKKQVEILSERLSKF